MMFCKGTRRGFTMLELMIAVSVSTVVVGGLYGLFTVQSRQLIYQDQQMAMHQNLRFASDVLTRSARMAGFGTGGSTTGPMGYSYSSTSADDNSSLPAIISWDGGSSSPDAITMVYADPLLEMSSSVTTTESCGTTSITFDMTHRSNASKITNYSQDELLMCWDYAPAGGPESFLWSISSDGDSSTGVISVVSNSSSYSDYDALCSTSDNLPPVLGCSRGHVVSFYIDNDSSDGVGPGSKDHPVLMMDLNFSYPDGGPASDDVPLADDVEDLQIEYCAADLDCTDTSNWTDSLGLDNSGNYQGETVWMVRFSIIGRTPRTDVRSYQSGAGHLELRPALGNRTAGTTKDGYHRMLMSTEVTVRNLRLL